MTPSRALSLLAGMIVLAIAGAALWSLWPREGCGVPGVVIREMPPAPTAGEQSEPVADASGRAAVGGATPEAATSDEEAWLEGTVRDSDGRPIFEAWVRARVDGSHAPSPSAVPTDRKGCWRIEEVEPGLLLLEVEARAKGFRSARTKPRSAIVAGRNRVLDLELARAPGFSGRVLDARSNRPIQGAVVSVANDDDLWAERWVQSDAEGRFLLAGGLEDQLDVMVEKQGYAYDRTLWRASDAEHLVFLQPCVAVVSGLLLEPDGSPAVDETVYLRMAGETFSFLHADAKGRFRFQPFPAGPARVFGFGERKAGRRSRCVLLELELQPGENELRLVLEEPPESRITGLVLRDGAPLSHARLVIDQRAPGLMYPGNLDVWTVFTGDDGRFDAAGLLPAHYAVSFDALDASAGLPIAYELELAAGETSRVLRFECLPAVQFEGKVVAPYPNGSLRLELREPGAQSVFATSGVHGPGQEFSFTAVPRGRYRLRLLDRGELLTELEVGPDPERRIELLPAK